MDDCRKSYHASGAQIFCRCVPVLLLVLSSPNNHCIPLTHALALPASPSSATTIRIGSRSSKLALSQARRFQNILHDSQRTGRSSNRTLQTEIVHINAAGDQTGEAGRQHLPLALSDVDFIGALDDAVLNSTVDVAVHSLKDIPPACRWGSNGEIGDSNNIIIGAYLGPRSNPLDVLISKDGSIDSIQTLPHGARVGSASIRRQAQLKANRSDLRVINIRGNVDARLKALEDGEIEALILAIAGLKRLGIINNDGHIIKQKTGVGDSEKSLYYHPIPIETMLPGCGQGVIAITCRSDNTDILSLLTKVDDHQSRIAASTERAFLDIVQHLSPWNGRPPVAGFMRHNKNSQTWLFNGLLATPDGAQILHVKDSLDANGCSEEMAQDLGRIAGEEVANIAGDGFFDGYF